MQNDPSSIAMRLTHNRLPNATAQPPPSVFGRLSMTSLLSSSALRAPSKAQGASLILNLLPPKVYRRSLSPSNGGWFIVCEKSPPSTHRAAERNSPPSVVRSPYHGLAKTNDLSSLRIATAAQDVSRR